MLQELDGKVAVITGGGSGIGASLARACAAEGMRVVVADVNGDRAEAVASELPTTPRRASPSTCPTPRRCRSSPTSPSTRSARCTCSATTPASPPSGACGTTPTRTSAGSRRQPLRRRQRPPQLRAPHDRAGRGPHREHRLGRELRVDAPPRALLRDQARDRRAVRGAALRARRHGHRGERARPRGREHQHRRLGGAAVGRSRLDRRRLQRARRRARPDVARDDRARRRRRRHPRRRARRAGTTS